MDGIGWISTPLSEPTAKALLAKGKPINSTKKTGGKASTATTVYFGMISS
jgi:hydrogenase maturation factor HypE